MRLVEWKRVRYTIPYNSGFWSGAPRTRTSPRRAGHLSAGEFQKYKQILITNNIPTLLCQIIEIIKKLQVTDFN